MMEVASAQVAPNPCPDEDLGSQCIFHDLQLDRYTHS